MPDEPGVYTIHLKDGKKYVGMSTANINGRVTASMKPNHAVGSKGYGLNDVENVTWPKLPSGTKSITARRVEQTVMEGWKGRGVTLLNRRDPELEVPKGDYLNKIEGIALLEVRPTQRLEIIMGTWGAGLFDSDTARDYLDTVVPMSPIERFEFIAQTLESGKDGGVSATLSVAPEEVIAAASIVAANMPGGDRFPWDEEVHGISNWLPRPVSSEIVTSALHALDVAIPSDGWWWRGWIDSTDRAQMQGSLEEVRRLLQSRRC